jgi:hypothetical protein
MHESQASDVGEHISPKDRFLTHMEQKNWRNVRDCLPEYVKKDTGNDANIEKDRIYNFNLLVKLDVIVFVFLL